MRTGSFTVPNRVVLAPMAGVTDRPFRQLCRRLGAGLTVSEMVTSDPRLRTTRKTLRRIDHVGEPAPRSVQIAGADPTQLADAARFNVARGADIIDINMGCPAKKVCNVAAGSALLSDEALVGRILDRVVAAVEVPVTLKIRTGPCPDRRNAVQIARIAESAGIAAVTVHGRTRKCAFRGRAEYDSIRSVKRAVSIPVIANGDITSPQQARRVLSFTGADAVMIGRAAQGNPWLPGAIAAYLHSGAETPPPDMQERGEVLLGHLRALHAFYGEVVGVRVARKHLSWHCRAYPHGERFWRSVNRVEGAKRQLDLTRGFFHRLIDESPARLGA
ncbi:MAG: tRNA dihydrouridine synthase DusB [Thiotrichales bacterium]|nr:tRNA dihydrouridine synthase DusB [Thiotrichales bacterium]